jgi:antitoxin MazE
MKTTLIAIGNSRGVRIPKPLIEQCGLEGEIEMAVRQNEIVIRPMRHPRAGWEEAGRRLAEAGEDKLLDGDSPPTRWDLEEWEWK